MWPDPSSSTTQSLPEQAVQEARPKKVPCLGHHQFVSIYLSCWKDLGYKLNPLQAEIYFLLTSVTRFLEHACFIDRHLRGHFLARLFLTSLISTKCMFIIYQVDCGSVLQPVAMKKIEQATHTLNHWRYICKMAQIKDTLLSSILSLS